MHATIRRYDSRELADQLAAHSNEVESMMSQVHGLRSYHLVRTEDGCASITVCDDQAGLDESTQLAGSWIADNLPGLAGTTPQVSSGEIIAHTRGAVTA
jgi:hypothetical protein